MKTLLATIALALAPLSVVSTAHAQDATPTPPPAPTSTEPPRAQITADRPLAEERTTFPNVPLLVSGVVVFGASYAASAIYGGVTDRAPDQKLVYPIAGPWMDLANRDCGPNPCRNETWNEAVLIADGIVQGLGALGIVTSLFVPETTTRSWPLVGDSDVRLTPLRIGYEGYGMGAVGRF